MTKKNERKPDEVKRATALGPVRRLAAAASITCLYLWVILLFTLIGVPLTFVFCVIKEALHGMVGGLLRAGWRVKYGYRTTSQAFYAAIDNLFPRRPNDGG